MENKIEYLGQTKGKYIDSESYLFKYIDKEAGKIIYMYQGGTADSGRGIAVTDINNDIK